MRHTESSPCAFIVARAMFNNLPRFLTIGFSSPFLPIFNTFCSIKFSRLDDCACPWSPLHTRLRRVRLSSFPHVWRLLLPNVALKERLMSFVHKRCTTGQFRPIPEYKAWFNVFVTFALTKKTQQKQTTVESGYG